MLRNTQSFTIPKYAGIVSPKLHTVLSKYFDSHSFDETEMNLSELLQAWISADTENANSSRHIANKVFFLSNLNVLVRKLEAVHTQYTEKGDLSCA